MYLAVIHDRSSSISVSGVEVVRLPFLIKFTTQGVSLQFLDPLNLQSHDKTEVAPVAGSQSFMPFRKRRFYFLGLFFGSVFRR